MGGVGRSRNSSVSVPALWDAAESLGHPSEWPWRWLRTLRPCRFTDLRELASQEEGDWRWRRGASEGWVSKRGLWKNNAEHTAGMRSWSGDLSERTRRWPMYWEAVILLSELASCRSSRQLSHSCPYIQTGSTGLLPLGTVSEDGVALQVRRGSGDSEMRLGCVLAPGSGHCLPFWTQSCSFLSSHAFTCFSWLDHFLSIFPWACCLLIWFVFWSSHKQNPLQKVISKSCTLNILPLPLAFLFDLSLYCGSSHSVCYIYFLQSFTNGECNYRRWDWFVYSCLPCRT